MRRWWHAVDPTDWLRDVGTTPDYRFSLANERTFLAWIRTGLALVASGLAVDQLLPRLGFPVLRSVVAVVLIGMGVAAALHAVVHWRRCERAIRSGHDLPASRFAGWLAVTVAGCGVVLAPLVVLGTSR